MSRMSDRVFTVRQSAIDTLKNLSKKLGSSWAEKHAIPIIHKFQAADNFLYRMNFYLGVRVSYLNSNGVVGFGSVPLFEHFGETCPENY